MENPVLRVENLQELAKKPFLDVATDISDALVYLDPGASEVAHVSLGPSFLFGKEPMHSKNLRALQHLSE